MDTTYPAIVVDCIDGDTIIVSVSAVFLGDHLMLIARHLRIYGINAPEIHTTDPAQKAAGMASLAFARSIAAPGSSVKISVSPDGWRDKYGRLLASVTTNGGDFAGQMVANNHAAFWDGKGPKPW